MFDWTRAPQRQLSVRVYERAVVNPYRSLAAPMLSRYVRCRYRPSCSQYSLEAVRLHGFPKGAWLTVKRLCRCLPWVQPGTPDFVPPV
ncbi:MAG: membrane protein insertion efficiency factor YidD [Chthoniobacterales bacterium]